MPAAGRILLGSFFSLVAPSKWTFIFLRRRQMAQPKSAKLHNQFAAWQTGDKTDRDRERQRRGKARGIERGDTGERGQHLSLSFGCGEPMKWLNQLEAVIMRLTNEAREQERGEKGGEGWGACGTTTLCSLVHVASTSISEQAGCATCVPPLGASRILCDEIYA